MNISKEAKRANTNPDRDQGEQNEITTPNLIRAAGLSAAVAGTIFAVIQPIHPPDVLASVTTSAFITVHLLER